MSLASLLTRCSLEAVVVASCLFGRDETGDPPVPPVGIVELALCSRDCDASIFVLLRKAGSLAELVGDLTASLFARLRSETAFALLITVSNVDSVAE